MLRKIPTNALYVKTTLFTLLYSYVFQNSRVILREPWYVLCAGSWKYMSTCKYQIKDPQVIYFLAVVKLVTSKIYVTDNKLLLIWHLRLNPYFVEPAN
jgi:hypothetical protein